MARSNVQQVQPRLVHEQESTGNSVGAILRGARLARGEDLEEIAKSLRIRHPYLEAIEEGRFADLPGLTYAVGFVRGYAKYLGLDTDDLVERFRGEARSLEQKTELVFPEPLPSSRVPGAALLFIVVLLSGLTYGGWLYLSSQDKSVAELVPALPDNLAQLIDRATGKDDATLAGTTGTDATGIDATDTTPAPETAQAPEATGTAPEAATETTAEATGETTGEASVEGTLNDVASALSGADASVETSVAEEAAATPIPDQEASPDQETSPETVPGTTPESAASDATAAAEAETADTPESAAASEPAVAPESDEAPSPDAATTPSVDVESLPEPQTTQLDRLVEDATDTQTASTGATQESEAQTQTQTETTATSASASNAGKVYGTDSPDARVVIEAKMAAWVSVESAAGETVFSGTMYPGDRFRVPNRSDLTLITGNAGAFDVRVDGRAAPPFGSLGEVRRDVALDPASLLPSN